MFREVLKLALDIDESTLRTFEKKLQTRFQKVSDKFKKSMKSSLTSIFSIGAITGLVDKFLNPLQETQEAIDRSLRASDDIATNAKQFNTTSGKLLKLIAASEATGLDKDNLFTLVAKFQTAVAEAKANPTEPSAVKNFKNIPDTADAFFEFIQSLQKMTKDQQILVQQSVFGEKQILRMADFLQTDFPLLFKQMGLNKISADKLSRDNDKVADLNDLENRLTAERNLRDVSAKGQLITESMIRSKAAADKVALEKENQRIASYNDLRAISQTAEKISGLVEKGVAMVGSLINTITPAINSIVEKLDKLMKSRWIRGILGKDGD